MMKRLFSFLLALLLMTLPLCAVAEEGAGTGADGTYYSKAWLCNPAYGYAKDVTVLVVTNDPARKEMTPEQVAAEIRFIPFDAAAGVYGTGEGALFTVRLYHNSRCRSMSGRHKGSRSFPR